MFPGGKTKALTFSYDDGVGQDRRLVALLNRYGLKGTFNLNSGLQDSTHHWVRGGVEIRRMDIEGLPDLYRGHEIACHALTHPRLETLEKEEIEREILIDRENLERLCGRTVRGFAYPYGTYGDTAVEVLAENGFGYARTTQSSGDFEPQKDLLRFKPTCRHADAGLMDLAQKFAALQTDEPKVFTVWGHSYEFDMDRNWDAFERFCAFIAGRDDIFYGTNAEVLLG